jgi:type I restriction enzyme S subunit
VSWKTSRLGNVLTLKRGHDLPDSQRLNGDVPVVSSSGITGRHSEPKAKAPGVVTGRYGTLGAVFYIEEDYWPLNTALYVTDFKGNHPRFAAYLLENLLRDYQSDKAAVPGVNRNVLHELKVRYPDSNQQERIAAILSAYDDLIEINRRRMALLEDAARELYREWFVRLRFPGHEHTRIADGVPEGWERRTFSEACSCLEDGDWIETKDQGGDDYRLLQISNIGINEFIETGNFRYVTEDTFRRLNCRELLPGHILIARMPSPIGRAWLITEMPWRMITAVDAAIAVANEELADAYFLTHYLNSPASLEHCERRAVGATRPRIARRELAALPLLLPPRPLQNRFREFAEPLNQNRAVLYRQNEKLRAARDLLLPRLISGEICVMGVSAP